jgi:hypothetical protein
MANGKTRFCRKNNNNIVHFVLMYRLFLHWQFLIGLLSDKKGFPLIQTFNFGMVYFQNQIMLNYVFLIIPFYHP